MSYKRLETLEDVHRFGLCLRITCEKCGRQAIFTTSSFQVSNVRFSIRLERLAARMRCSTFPGEPPGCGHKGARIMAIDWPERKPAALPPRPAYHPAPAGVDQAAWDKADSYERKRLIRRARG